MSWRLLVLCGKSQVSCVLQAKWCAGGAKVFSSERSCAEFEGRAVVRAGYVQVGGEVVDDWGAASKVRYRFWLCAKRACRIGFGRTWQVGILI
jgi:hypothetical protein